MIRLLLIFAFLVFAPLHAADYAIVVSEATAKAWPEIIDALAEKYPDAVTLQVADGAKVADALKPLREHHPRHTCFVAQHPEVTRDYVARVHRLTRQLDDDPYTDTQWGILTGFDKANALAIATHAEPLTIRKVASGTEVALQHCAEGQWYCELKKGHSVHKPADGDPAARKGPTDSTRALANTLTDYNADLFVTSGPRHRTQLANRLQL